MNTRIRMTSIWKFLRLRTSSWSRTTRRRLIAVSKAGRSPMRRSFSTSRNRTLKWKFENETKRKLLSNFNSIKNYISYLYRFRFTACLSTTPLQPYLTFFKKHFKLLRLDILNNSTKIDTCRISSLKSRSVGRGRPLKALLRIESFFKESSSRRYLTEGSRMTSLKSDCIAALTYPSFDRPRSRDITLRSSGMSLSL